MIDELGRHGYRLSAGTLYPILHGMERQGYLRSQRTQTGGRTRRLYRVTPAGRKAPARQDARDSGPPTARARADDDDACAGHADGATTDRTFVIRIRGGKTEWVDVKTGLTFGPLVEVFGDLKD